MKKTFLTIALALVALQPNAQNVKFEWATAFGANGANNDNGYSIHKDIFGDLYMTGEFWDTVDFDPGTGVYPLVSHGWRDVYVTRLDDGGNFIWARSFGGNNHESGRVVTTDDSGYVYVLGVFADTVDFDPDTGVYKQVSRGGWDIFIEKLDRNGNFIWVKTIGGPGYDNSYSLTSDVNGNLYITGGFTDTVDFDPGTTEFKMISRGNVDVFVLKLNRNGEFIWVRSMGGVLGEEGEAMGMDGAGHLYLGGIFRGTVDFDPGPSVFNLTSNGNADIFIQKMDTNGNFIWARSAGGTGLDDLTSIAVDPWSNVYATGSYQNTVDFDPGPASHMLTATGYRSIYLEKLDSSGNFAWAGSIGGNFDFGTCVTTDAMGDVYLAGIFTDTIDFAPGPAVHLHSGGYEDIFIDKLSSSGNFIWVTSFGGNNSDNSNDMLVDGDGNIYSTGRSRSIVSDFDPGPAVFNLNIASHFDAFVQKLSPCTTLTSTFSHMACDAYTWIDGITYTGSNNSATYTTVASNGCDSVITLDLTINETPEATDTVVACHSYTWINNETYTTSIDTPTYLIPGGAVNGCDSMVRLDLTINQVDVSVTRIDTTLIANEQGAEYQWLDCDSGYAVLAGDTTPYFIASVSGTFAVEVRKNNCIDTSACYEVYLGPDTTIGRTGNDLFKRVSIYPNPNRGSLTIDPGDLRGYTIHVFDCQGRLVHQVREVNISPYHFELNTPPGIYLVELSAGDRKMTRKVVKQ